MATRDDLIAKALQKTQDDLRLFFPGMPIRYEFHAQPHQFSNWLVSILVNGPAGDEEVVLSVYEDQLASLIKGDLSLAGGEILFNVEPLDLRDDRSANVTAWLDSWLPKAYSIAITEISRLRSRVIPD